MADGNWYRDGTVTLTKGAAVVVGDATYWVGQAQPGDQFRSDGSATPYEVVSVDSDAQITIRPAWDGPTSARATYSITRFWGRRLPDQLAANVAGLLSDVRSKVSDPVTVGQQIAETRALANQAQTTVANAQALAANGKWSHAYDTYAQMAADLAPADRVLVRVGPLEPDPAKRGLYRKSGAAGTGSWVYWGPSDGEELAGQVSANQAEIGALKARVDPFQPVDKSYLEGKSLAAAWADDNGKTALAVTDEGRVVIPFDGALIGGDTTYKESRDPGWVWGITDQADRVALGVRPDGSVFPFGSLANALKAQVCHILLYGQSLPEGSESMPPLHIVPLPYGGLMFSRGVRTWSLTNHPLDPAGRPDSDFIFQALREGMDGALGETEATGLVATLKDLINGIYLGGNRGAEPEILVTFAGRGGRRLHHLDKAHQSDPEGKYYLTKLDDVRRAKARATAEGKTYACIAEIYMQGERDGDFALEDGGPILDRETFVETWATDFVRYAKDTEADVRAIDGLSCRFPVIVYQTLNLSTSQAQLRAVDKAPGRIFMSSPHYAMPSALNSRYQSGGEERHGAPVHLAPDTQAWNGSRHALDLYRIVVQGEDVQPLRPFAATWVDAQTLDLSLCVPRPPVVVDTTWLPKQGTTYGFDLRRADGTGPGPTVSAIRAIRPDVLRITLATARLAGTAYTLRYGWNSAVSTVASATVASSAAGPVLPNGQPSTDIVMSGPVTDPALAILRAEGVFLLDNVSTGKLSAMPVRVVTASAGATVFRGETREIAAGATFTAGDVLAFRRVFGFGNVRDSDNAVSPLTFSDAAVGTRQGQRFPLWAWLVIFDNLEIV